MIVRVKIIPVIDFLETNGVIEIMLKSKLKIHELSSVYQAKTELQFIQYALTKKFPTETKDTV